MPDKWVYWLQGNDRRPPAHIRDIGGEFAIIVAFLLEICTWAAIAMMAILLLSLH